MYCPKCGDKMIPQNNTMFCERGGMLLSKTLYARFQARFLERVPEEPLLQRINRPKGNWFCPACGKPMKFSDGYLTCPDGHGSINDSIFDLNSLNPHDRTNPPNPRQR